MKTKLSYDPVLNLYDILYTVINRYHVKGLNITKELDPLIYKILMSNACKTSERETPKSEEFYVIDDELKIIFIENTSFIKTDRAVLSFRSLALSRTA